MSDPIPSASGDPDSVEQSHPANAEDRKAAAALDSLHTNELAADGPAKGPSSADQEALGKAMSRLEIAAGKSSARQDTAETQKKEAEVKKKAVKVVASDVTFLSDQLDLHKNKATDLLKAHDGNVTAALKAFIAPSWS